MPYNRNKNHQIELKWDLISVDMNLNRPHSPVNRRKHNVYMAFKMIKMKEEISLLFYFKRREMISSVC